MDAQDCNLRLQVKRDVLKAVAAGQRAGGAAGLDIIIDTIDDWIGTVDELMALLGHTLPVREEGPFLGVSDALKEIDPSQIKPTYVIAVLTCTFKSQDRIPSYADFYQRTRRHLEKVRPDDVDALLQGFEPAHQWRDRGKRQAECF